MKRKIRLTENDLHRIIKESVKKVLSEERFKTIKPHSEEYYNSHLYDPDYEDGFADWEKDADKYDTFYNYDKELPVRVKPNQNQGYYELKHTPTRKSFEDYLERQRQEHHYNGDPWKDIKRVNTNFDYDNFFSYRPNKNLDNDSSEWFRSKFLDDGYTDDKIQRDIRGQLAKLKDERRKDAVKQRRELKKDIEVADKRPLHRKGSLNRDIK
jgi:hypothetical protein